MITSYQEQRNNRVKTKYNFPAGADISGVIRNVESSIINDSTFVSELAEAFSNSTGTFQALVTGSLTGGTAYLDSLTGGSTYLDSLTGGAAYLGSLTGGISYLSSITGGIGYFGALSSVSITGGTITTSGAIYGANIYGATGSFGELIIPTTGIISTLGSIYYDRSGTGTLKIYNGSTWVVFYHS
jgi:hypothetical protein